MSDEKEKTLGADAAKVACAGSSDTPNLTHAETTLSDRLLGLIPSQAHDARANWMRAEVRSDLGRQCIVPVPETEALIAIVTASALSNFGRIVFATLNDQRLKDATPDDVLRFVGVIAKRTAHRIETGNQTSNGTSGSVPRDEAQKS